MVQDAENIEELISPERWNKLETVFDAALAVGPAEQQGFLKQACIGDRELQRELESLLAADLAPDDLLTNGAFDLYMKVMAEETLKDESKNAVETEIRPGMTLDDHWKIVERIPGGGMGVVYLARDQRLNRRVAVKLLLEESLRNEQAVRKFKQEAEALARLDYHPGIVGILDVGALPGGQPYLVMQYVDGVTLGAKLREQPEGLDLKLTADIIAQAADALGAAHQSGILHRDLKPENIMLQQLGEGRLQVKIIDFGVAKVRDSEVAKTTIGPSRVGTPLYMAPEQLRAETVTAKSEVYTLGVIAHELLTGRRPFVADSIEKLIELQKKGVPVKPCALRPGLSLKAERVILRALSYKATNRQPSAREFGDQLAQALSSVEPPPDDSWWDKIVRILKWLIAGKRRLVGAASVAVLIAVISLWLWPFHRGPTQTPIRTVELLPERALTYWLTIMRRDGKTIRATGRETFDTGDKFRFNMTPAQAGALYLFNEGTSQNWHVLFPSPENHHEEARLTAFEKVETIGNKFTNETGTERGTEKIWIVWARQPIELLDGIVKQSVKSNLTISDASQRAALRQFMAQYGTPTPEVRVDRDQTVTLKGRGEVLVYLLELENKDWK